MKKLSLIFGVLIIAAPILAAPMRFQGRLTNSEGRPLSGESQVKFKIFDDPDFGNEIWAAPNLIVVNTNDHGLFTTNFDVPADIFNTSTPLYLEVIVRGVGGEQALSPRQLLTSVPYSFGADHADRAAIATTVEDGSITTPKIADNAVTQQKIPINAVGSLQIQDGSVSFLDIAPDAVRSENIQDESVKFVDLASNAVTSDNIQNESITGVDIASNSIGGAKLTDDSIPGAKIELDSISQQHLVAALRDSLLPSGLISMFAAGCPTGWTPLAEANGRFPIGVESGTEIPTGGTGTVVGALTTNDGAHQHQVQAHQHDMDAHMHSLNNHRHVAPVAVNVSAPSNPELFHIPYDSNQWGQGFENHSGLTRTPGVAPATSGIIENWSYLKTKVNDVPNSGNALKSSDASSNPLSAATAPMTEIDAAHQHELEPIQNYPPFFGVHYCVKN